MTSIRRQQMSAFKRNSFYYVTYKTNDESRVLKEMIGMKPKISYIELKEKMTKENKKK